MTGFTYQWKRGGVAITGATANTYTLVSADLTTNITASVTATNNAALSTTATSAAVGPITSANTFAGYALAFQPTTADYWVGGTKYTPITTLPGYSYTRSGIQGAVTSTGTVAFFAANTPAINDRGFHNYPALTNLALQSQAFDDAAWTKGGGVAAAPTVTANQIAAPDGTTTADKIDLPAVSGASAYSLVYQLINVGTAVSSASIFLKGVAGGEVIWMHYSPDGVTYYRQQCTLTTVWQRFVLVATPANASEYLMFGVDLRDAGQSAKAAQSFYAWQCQTIAGNYPDGGAIIATTTASASIGAEVLNNTDAPTNIEQLFFVRWNAGGRIPDNYGRIAEWSGPDVGHTITISSLTGKFYAEAKAAGSSVLGQSSTANHSLSADVVSIVKRTATGWRVGDYTAGVLTWHAAENTSAFPTISKLNIGTDISGGQPANGIRIRGIYRKTGDFSTDALVIAAITGTG